MSVDEMVKQVAQTLEKDGNARAIFAEPVKLESHTVIPVAAVSMAGGGAGTGGLPRGSGAVGRVARFLGGGGGGGLEVRPVGFIHESGTEVVFTSIHIDGKGKPLVTEAATGLGRVVGALASIFASTQR